MLKHIMFVFVSFFALFFYSCFSGPSYTITMSNTGPDSLVRSAWFSYASHISSDMDKFYKKNPEGEYIIPFLVELEARNKMIDFYLRVQNDRPINDQYIEDMIIIRNAVKFKEYVFFSFNQGYWENENNFEKDEYDQWMESNMPEHVPLTLAHVKKAD